jgi:hypothetical protein
MAVTAAWAKTFSLSVWATSTNATEKGLAVTREELIAYFEATTAAMLETVKRKNADYAGAKHGEDAFANFKAVEHLGLCSVETGMLTRMSDKLARLATYVATGQLVVKDESVKDTLLDLANYAILMAAYVGEKRVAAELAKDKQERCAMAQCFHPRVTNSRWCQKHMASGCPA